MTKRSEPIRLRSFGGPWTGPNSDVDVVIVERDYLWIGTRRGGMSIHGRKTLLAIADTIYKHVTPAPGSRPVKHPEDDVREVVHRCPEGDSGLTPCCDRSPFELSPWHRLTVFPESVTCPGRGETDG